MDLPPDIREKVDEIKARSGRRRPIRNFRERLKLERTFPEITRISPKEAAVVELVAEGLATAEIASRLFLAETTVKSHVQHALLRTESRNRTHLAVRFVRGEFRVGPSR